MSVTKTVRVDVERLDELMKLIGELVINRTRLSKIAKDVEDESVDRDTLKREMMMAAGYIGRISTELQEQIMKMRMVPISQLFGRFPRIVRDLSKKLNKKVQLVMEGQETELDRNIVETLSDPMVHIIRNAIDHGIELPEERAMAGKPEIGTIKLIAYHEGNNIVVIVEDDGRGIDPEKIAKKALEKGLVTQEKLARMSKREILNLIFMPGFSTADKVTDLSGRGVGMDVVATAVEKLKGSVEVDSKIGEGTRIIMKLPLTLAILEVFLFKSGEDIFAIPLNVVNEVIPIKLSDIREIGGEKLITIRGDVYKVAALPDVMSRVKFEPKDDKAYVIIVSIAEKRFGILIDGLVGQDEIVVKSLGNYLAGLQGISGVTILGDGRVILIMDVAGFYRKMEEMQEV